MAALSITAANVVTVSGSIERGFFGGTVTAGMAVKKSTTDSTFTAAVNDTANNAAVWGVALNGGAAGQPAAVQRDGQVTIGATVAVGKWYAVGTGGGIIPVDDIATGVFPSLVGYGASASVLDIHPIPKTVAAAADVT